MLEAELAEKAQRSAEAVHASGVLFYRTPRGTSLEELDSDVLAPCGWWFEDGISPEIIAGLPCPCVINWLLQEGSGTLESIGQGQATCVVRLLHRLGGSTFRKVVLGTPWRPWMVAIFLNPSASASDASFYEAVLDLAVDALPRREVEAERQRIRAASSSLQKEVWDRADPRELDRYSRILMQAVLTFLQSSPTEALRASIHLFQANDAAMDVSRDVFFSIKRLRAVDYHQVLGTHPEIESLCLSDLSGTPYWDSRFREFRQSYHRNLDGFTPGLQNRRKSDRRSAIGVTFHAAALGEAYGFSDAGELAIREIAKKQGAEFVTDYYWLNKLTSKDRGTYRSIVVPLVDRDHHLSLGALNIEGYSKDGFTLTQFGAIQLFGSMAAKFMQQSRIRFLTNRNDPELFENESARIDAVAMASRALGDYFGADCSVWTLGKRVSPADPPIATDRRSQIRVVGGWSNVARFGFWRNEGSLFADLVRLVGTLGLAVYRKGDVSVWTSLVGKHLGGVEHFVPGDLRFVVVRDAEDARRLREAFSVDSQLAWDAADLIRRWLKRQGSQRKMLVSVPLEYGGVRADSGTATRPTYCAGVIELDRESGWTNTLVQHGSLRAFGALVAGLVHQHQLRDVRLLTTHSKMFQHDVADGPIQATIDRMSDSGRSATEGAMLGATQNALVYTQSLMQTLDWGKPRRLRTSLESTHAVVCAALLSVFGPNAVPKALTAGMSPPLDAAICITRAKCRVDSAHGDYHDLLPLFLAVRNFFANLRGWLTSLDRSGLTAEQQATLARSARASVAVRGRRVVIEISNMLPDWSKDANLWQHRWYPMGEPGEGRYIAHKRLASAYKDVGLVEMVERDGTRVTRVEIVHALEEEMKHD